MKPYKVVKIVFTILGTIMITICGFITYHKFVFNKNAKKTTGKVIKVTENNEYYSHLVKFTSKNKEYQFYGVNSFPPEYSVGEKLEVLYNPDNPKDATIVNLSSNWGALIITGGLGFVFFGVGLGIFILSSLKTSIKDNPDFQIKTLLYIFIFTGLIILTISSLITYPKLEFKRKAQTGTGEIIQSIYHEGDESNLYLPIIKFNFSGEVYEFYGTTKTSKHHIGKKVKILFEKDNPHNAEIKSFWRTWSAFIILGGMGLMFMILPMFILKTIKN